MEQWIKNKFECKIRLRNAITEKYISKGNYEWILKYILKSNLFLVKHYPLIKDFTDKMMNECNELLSYDFFMNDKILIIWIARKLNHYVKIYPHISNGLKQYLEDKNENMKNWDNKYRKKLYERTLIKCDDNSFDNYLPVSTRGISDKYKEFEEELRELNKYYVGNSKYIFTDEELQNINDFVICNIDKEKLKSEIKNIVDNYKKLENVSISNTMGNGNNIVDILDLIFVFEKIKINCNYEYNFMDFIENNRYGNDCLYQLMKTDRFHYNVDDDFFIVDEKDDGEIIDVVSINNILSLNYIDIDKWIKYFQSHDINSMDWNEVYIDNGYFRRE